jgi:hypothetical protein
MRQALVIALLLWAAFYVTAELLSFRVSAAIGFAATTLIAAANCATFLWLWYVRATPLALGMALSWAGQAALSVWWFSTGMPGKALWIEQDPSVFLVVSIYIVGGALHIAVIQNSSGMRRAGLVWPAMIVASVAAGVAIAA